MANPVIKVVLSAVDQVTGTAKKAADGLDDYAGRAKKVLSTLAALGVGVALGEFFRQSIEEARNAEVGMGRLGVAVNNAGGNFKDLSPQLEATIARVQKLSVATDDELREALTRLIAVSGDVKGSQENLGLVSDIAAYKQISLSDAADLVGKTMAGNISAFTRYGIVGTSATEVLQKARDAFGGFAEKESKTFFGAVQQISNGWGDFQEAVGVAILSGGEMSGVATGLADVLRNLVSWVEDNEAGIRVFTGAVSNAIGALYDVGKTIYDVVQPALGPVLKVLLGAIVLGVETAAFGVREFAAAWKSAAGQVLDALGYLVEKGGAVLKVFGVKVVAEAGASIRSFGQDLVKSANADAAQAVDLYQKGLGNLVRGRVESHATLETAERIHTDRVAGIVDKAAETAAKKAEAEAAKQLAAQKKRDEDQLKQLQTIGAQLAAEQNKQGAAADAAAKLLAGQLRVNLGEATARSLQLTTAAMEDLLEQLRGKIPIEQWQALNEKVQQHRRDLGDLLPPAEGLADAAKRAADENKRIADEQDKQRKNGEENVRKAGDLARAFIDAASATGLIDDKMSSILNSAISLATNIGKAFGGDPTAIAASVTSLANIIVGLGTSETERRRQAASASNTLALDRLTREVGNLNLRESGKTFAGIQTAVDASVQARADARAAGKGPGAADEAAKAAFLKSLAGSGIGLEEARALFKELFGRDLALANAGTFFQDILAFKQGLSETEFGTFGQGFEGQLQALQTGFDIFGTTDDDEKLRQYRDLAAKFSPALAEALGGDLSTPEGRAAAQAALQDLYRKLNTPGALSPEQIGVSGPQFLALLQAILPLIAGADGLTGAGVPAGLVAGLGAGASASVLPAGGGLPLGAPGLDLPTPAGLGTFTGGTTGAVTINGGVHPTIIVHQQPAEEQEAFIQRIAVAVDEISLRRYDSLLAATGAFSQVTGS